MKGIWNKVAITAGVCLLFSLALWATSYAGTVTTLAKEEVNCAGSVDGGMTREECTENVNTLTGWANEYCCTNYNIGCGTLCNECQTTIEPWCCEQCGIGCSVPDPEQEPEAGSGTGTGTTGSGA